MQESDFFMGIKQASLAFWSQQAPVPLFYRDLAYMGVYLLAPLDKLWGLLPSRRMQPYRLTPWHGIVTITASQFRDSDVGPYQAVSIGVPVFLDKVSPLFTGILRRPPEVPMIYLLHLPVSSERALAAGVAIANFPEFLADIGFESNGRWTHCNAGAEGKKILSLSGRKLDTRPFPRQRVQPLTRRQDRLLRSELIYSEGEAAISRSRSDVRLEFGDHPLGLQLKELGLGRALLYQYCPAGSATLSPVCESYHL